MSHFALLGSTRVKAAHKHVGEIDPWCQFHQRFLRAFFVRIFGAKPNATRENNVCTKNLNV
jgi:hypothetical protein